MIYFCIVRLDVKGVTIVKTNVYRRSGKTRKMLGKSRGIPFVKFSRHPVRG